MLYSYVLTGFSRRTRQSLQKYEKSESHMLVCTDCPLPHLVRNSRSQEHCAQKCKKVKKNFNCRWVAPFLCPVSEAKCVLISLSLLCSRIEAQYLHIFVVYHWVISQLLPVCSCRAFNFQRHNRKCHLLPFDRFTHGVKKVANVNFTLYEKKGECRHFSEAAFPLPPTLNWCCVFLFFSWERSGAERDSLPNFPAGDCRLSLLTSAPWF